MRKQKIFFSQDKKILKAKKNKNKKDLKEVEKCLPVFIREITFSEHHLKFFLIKSILCFDKIRLF